MNEKFDDDEATWETEYEIGNGLTVRRKIRGVFETLSLGPGIFRSPDSQHLSEIASEIVQYFTLNMKKLSLIHI